MNNYREVLMERVKMMIWKMLILAETLISEIANEIRIFRLVWCSRLQTDNIFMN